jgi:hypothetical protein
MSVNMNASMKVPIFVNTMSEIQYKCVCVCVYVYIYILLNTSLGALAELRKATLSFVAFIRLSVRMEQLGSHRTNFYEFEDLSIFRQSEETIRVSLKSDKHTGFFA